MLALGAFTFMWVIGVAMTDQAAAQAEKASPKAAKTAKAATPPGQAIPAPGQSAGETFKAVHTSTLQGLTVDDFMGAMGVMAAALGFDCSDCHPGAGSDKVDWVFDTPKKITARKMTEMVANINRQNFSGAQMVTCWTCHHGREKPATSIALDTLYGPPNDEKDDIVARAPDEPAPNVIIDKYLAAIGGAQKVATLNSFIATGTSVGYERLGGGGTFEIYAKAPNQCSVTIVFKDHPERGDSTRIFNGTTGWIRTPRALLREYQLVGSELDGARIDAQLAFPAQIKTVLTNLRTGFTDIIDGKDVAVVQGTGARGLLVTLYFDKQSGLLVRMLRFARSPIGRVPTQTDYADYRDVNGIKFPFKYTFSWLDGKDSFELTNVRVNVPIDAAKFARPTQ